jgi:hypothetical protein
MSRGLNKQGEKGKREKGETGKKPVNQVTFTFSVPLLPAKHRSATSDV